MFERFTERARQVVVLAQEEARALRHNYIGTEHILLGLLREEEGVAARVLESLGITADLVRANVVRIVQGGEEVSSGQIPFTPRAKRVLELALREALSLGHNYIGTEHILLGLLSENEGVGVRILLESDVDSEKIRTQVIRMVSGGATRAQARSMATTPPASPQIIDQAWFGGLGVVLDDLAAEIHREHKRTPDTGDLLLALASSPDTLAGRALRELAIHLDGLPDVVMRLRAQALAEDELARRLLELTEAKEQAIANMAELRAQERELRERWQARAVVKPEVLKEIRRQLGIPSQTDDPPPAQRSRST